MVTPVAIAGQERVLPAAEFAISSALIQRQIEYRAEREETEQEGIVVWDQKGLVVVWPDGHCSRFLWAMLRHSCPCRECRKQRGDEEGAPLDFPGGVTSLREVYEPVLLP